MKSCWIRTLLCGTLILFPLSLWGCQTPKGTLPGTSNVGVLQKKDNEELRVYLGKPETYGQDDTESYRHREDGLLGDKTVGVEGTWKF